MAADAVVLGGWQPPLPLFPFSSPQHYRTSNSRLDPLDHTSNLVPTYTDYLDSHGAPRTDSTKIMPRRGGQRFQLRLIRADLVVALSRPPCQRRFKRPRYGTD